MEQIEQVVSFLLDYGGYYNRPDRALYSDGDITDEKSEFSCFSVAKILIRTLLGIDQISKDTFDSANISKLFPELEPIYSNTKFPDLIDLPRNGVYCFDTETSFEGHCFLIVKYDNIYYYIGGYGGVDEYIIHKLTYSSLYDKLYSIYVTHDLKLYRSFFTRDNTDMKDFFVENSKQIRASVLKMMSIYYVSSIDNFNLDAFRFHFDMIVSKLNKSSYYKRIFTDVASCESGFCYS